jgi:hypothetical protein
VFLNSPENIQHVCATNVKNYNMRYLPVRRTAAVAAAAAAAAAKQTVATRCTHSRIQQCKVSGYLWLAAAAVSRQ